MDDTTRAELLNATVDGVATEAQRAAVADLLERDPSAREELEALRAVADLPRRVPVPETPDGFTESVMERRARAATGWPDRLRAALAAMGWSWGPLRGKTTNLAG
jgi:anti-sigma factor RsiW